MLDPNSFDKAVKAAEKLNKILEKSNSLAQLKGIDVTVSQLQSAADQVGRLLRRNQMLKDIVTQLALKQAGLNRYTAERIQYYDRELNLIKRNKNALQSQIDARRVDRQNMAANMQKDLAMLQRQINTRKAYEAGLQAKFNAISPVDPKSVDIAEDFARSRERTLALEEQLKDKQQESIRLRDKSLKQIRDMEDELKDQLVLESALANQRNIDRKAIYKAQQRDEAKSFIKNNFGGGIIGKLGELSKSILKLGLILGPLALIALAIKSLIGAYRDTLKATIDIGLDASQRTKALFDAQRRVGIAASRGALISGEEMVKSADALSQIFGRIDIPDDLVVKSAELTRQLGLSSEEAASIFDLFSRIRGESAAAAATSAVVLKATALSNRANPAQVMRDVAANAANFAKSGRASADELARAAILVRRLGVDLGTVSGIADRLVSDFEGALESQATIGAFAPGFDQTGLMIAAQFGTDEDIARELKASVDSLGMDFDTLPRSFKLSIAGAMGMSVEQLAKIAKSTGDAMDMVSPDANAMIKAEENKINELQQALVNPLGSLEKVVFSIFSFLTNRFGRSTEEKVSGLSGAELGTAALSKNDSFLSKIGITDRTSEVAQRKIRSDALEQGLAQYQDQLNKTDPSDKSRIEFLKREIARVEAAIKTTAESRAVGGVVGIDRAPAKSLKGTFEKLSSNEVPTILHKGEAVLNRAQMNMLGQMTGAQSTMAKSLTEFVGNFTQQIASPSGLIGKLTDTIVGNNSNSLLGSLTKTFGAGSGSLMSKLIGSFAGGKGIVKSVSGQGNLLGSVTKLFSGENKGGLLGSINKGKTVKNITQSLSGGQTGLLSKIGSLFGKKSTDNSKLSITKSVIGKTGISGLATNNLKATAANLVSKIPGIGNIASSFLKGGGIKGIAGNLLKGGAGKAIGGVLGSAIPIPGVGTFLGSAVGGLVSKGIGKLANSRVGKAVTGFIGKSPIGQLGKKYFGVAGKALGGIGKKLGGLFGKKKKVNPTPVVQPDMTQMANMSGMFSMMPSMSASNFQSGINFVNPTPYMSGGSPIAQQTAQADTSMQTLEAKFDTLINLFKSGGIVVNLDGKKVSEGLVDANRYG